MTPPDLLSCVWWRHTWQRLVFSTVEYLSKAWNYLVSCTTPSFFVAMPDEMIQTAYLQIRTFERIVHEAAFLRIFSSIVTAVPFTRPVSAHSFHSHDRKMSRKKKRGRKFTSLPVWIMSYTSLSSVTISVRSDEFACWKSDILVVFV